MRAALVILALLLAGCRSVVAPQLQSRSEAGSVQRMEVSRLASTSVATAPELFKFRLNAYQGFATFTANTRKPAAPASWTWRLMVDTDKSDPWGYDFFIWRDGRMESLRDGSTLGYALVQQTHGWLLVRFPCSIPDPVVFVAQFSPDGRTFVRAYNFDTEMAEPLAVVDPDMLRWRHR